MFENTFLKMQDKDNADNIVLTTKGEQQQFFVREHYIRTSWLNS